jgi:hypothetical protein
MDHFNYYDLPPYFTPREIWEFFKAHPRTRLPQPIVVRAVIWWWAACEREPARPRPEPPDPPPRPSTPPRPTRSSARVRTWSSPSGRPATPTRLRRADRPGSRAPTSRSWATRSRFVTGSSWPTRQTTERGGLGQRPAVFVPPLRPTMNIGDADGLRSAARPSR